MDIYFIHLFVYNFELLRLLSCLERLEVNIRFVYRSKVNLVF